MLDINSILKNEEKSPSESIKILSLSIQRNFVEFENRH